MNARHKRGVAQFGSARGLGPWGREFESLHPDQSVHSVGAFSSVGQSGRLITDWSAVRVREGPPVGPVVQLVRTLACHARGQGFESPSDRQILCLGSSVGRAGD